MSSEPALSVRGVSKSYRIAHEAPHTTVREAMLARLRSPLRGRSTAETFWALRDVDFDVNPGEVLGIVGRNGAGKSTLLKILSRITPPTTGEVRVRGTVGSLLEVGTGFHGELTGRENIYLNGAILGMRHAEIDRQFDAIVEFADVERFLDTPVKRYSSGMYVRLAFAVAAHLNPEVLIVDEVLAVGDAAFQAKCLGRMQQVAREEGRTVLFVSHNMAAVNMLCTRGLFLEQGRIAVDGPVADVVAAYNSRMPAASGEAIDLANAPRKGGKIVRFESVRVTPLDETTGDVLPAGRAGCDWKVESTFRANQAVTQAVVDTFVFDPNGYRLIDMSTSKAGLSFDMAEGDVQRATFVLKNALLKPGTYSLGIWVGTIADTYDLIEPASSFTVLTYSEGQRHEHYPGPYIARFSVDVTHEEPVSDGARGSATLAVAGGDARR